jgi:hypothetical protein
MKTINIFLSEEDAVINIMPEGYDPDMVEGVVRAVLSDILNEEIDVPIDTKPAVVLNAEEAKAKEEEEAKAA